MGIRIGLTYNLKPGAPGKKSGVKLESAAPSEASYRSLRYDLAQPDLYAEWDEPGTIDAVERALRPLGDVIRLEANADFPRKLAAAKPDFVFNIAEGLYGVNREGHVPAICEFLNIPYLGSDPLTLGLALHKGRTKEILQHHGVPTAPFRMLETRTDARNCDLPFPVFVKPAFEGSGKGVSVKSLCSDRKALVRQTDYLLGTYQEPVLAETYLPGAEFTVAILGTGESARCLPIVGMKFDELPEGAPPIYGYEAKWIWDSIESPLKMFECPARIPKKLAQAVRNVALSAYRVLECRDWGRVDVRCDAAGEPMLVELNPLPGILPDPRDNSCFPKAARAAGLTYEELIRTAADLAWQRISGRPLLAEVA